MSLLKLYCDVDDFCQQYKRIIQKYWKQKLSNGYLSQSLFDSLLEHDLQLIITNLHSKMKNRLLLLSDKLLLRKRSIIETINDLLENQSQIEHSRHRRPVSFVVNVLVGLSAYLWQRKNLPSIGLHVMFIPLLCCFSYPKLRLT